jgi:glutamyl/glutaminyl-tRNA synthetase
LRELLYPAADELLAATAELRDDDQARAVLEAFAAASRAGKLRTAAGYLETVEAVKEATGAKGRGLFHPLRLAISGKDTGPELKQLVPLLDTGAALSLQPAFDSVAERIERALQGE